jgi:hypothetical protein
VLIAALDAGSLPDAFTSRCGRSLDGALGTGVYLGVRASRGAFVGQVDTRLVWENMATGCDLSLRIVRVGDNLFEHRWIEFDGLPSVPFALSSIRAGAELRTGSVRLAGMGGAGVVWARRPLPAGLVAGSASIGRGTRALFVEMDLTQPHLRTTESRARFRPTPDGDEDLGTADVDITLRPTMFTVRAGLVWALVR